MGQKRIRKIRKIQWEEGTEFDLRKEGEKVMKERERKEA